MKQLVKIGGLLLLAGIVPAFADNPSGPYIGGAYGQFNLNINNLNDLGQAVTSITHSNDDAQKYFVGYRFMPYFSLEAAYVDLGNPSNNFTATGSDGHYRVHMDGWSPTAIGTLPLGPVELFAEAGYLFYNVNIDANYTSPDDAYVHSSHTRSDFLYGGGVGVTFFNHLNVRGEYQELNLNEYHNSDALWLAASWRF
jgi:opacity protein-like surface antigen